jgi:hypothetical protein
VESVPGGLISATPEDLLEAENQTVLNEKKEKQQAKEKAEEERKRGLAEAEKGQRRGIGRREKKAGG